MLWGVAHFQVQILRQWIGIYGSPFRTEQVLSLVPEGGGGGGSGGSWFNILPSLLTTSKIVLPPKLPNLVPLPACWSYPKLESQPTLFCAPHSMTRVWVPNPCDASPTFLDSLPLFHPDHHRYVVVVGEPGWGPQPHHWSLSLAGHRASTSI